METSFDDSRLVSVRQDGRRSFKRAVHQGGRRWSFVESVTAALPQFSATQSLLQLVILL